MSDIDIELFKTQIEQEINKVTSSQQLNELCNKYLGRKGIVAELTGSIPSLPKERRASFGRQVNELKTRINFLITEKQKNFAVSGETSVYSVDISMPGIAKELGRIHPITQIINEICSIFTRMGFSIVEGPEIETEENNFTGLNIPLEHPSREAFDTFYLKSPRSFRGLSSVDRRLLLRSHTSPVQIRVMKEQKPPLAVIAPGRVYRPDAVDASHLFMFHQIEGFMVNENINFSDLKGVLEVFLKAVFGEDIKMRFRPHFFPFTEPSAEVDISCIICRSNQQPAASSQQKCPVCHGKGWLEVLGSGMIHPNVFRNVGYNYKKYTGFAFGMGIERIAMLKYGISDIRLFYENDLRFLKQF